MEKVSHDVLGNSHDQGTHPTLSYSGYFPTSNQTFRLKRMTKISKIVVSQIPFRFCLFVCLLISEPQVENIDRMCVSQEMKKKKNPQQVFLGNISTIPTRRKYRCMFNLRNTNCIISVILHTSEMLLCLHLKLALWEFPKVAP